MKLHSYYLKWLSFYKNCALVWKEIAKQKRWRLILCIDAAARRKGLLKEANDAIKHGYYSRSLIERIDEELGDRWTKEELEDADIKAKEMKKRIWPDDAEGCELAEELGDG